MPIAITPIRKKDAPEVKRGEKAKPINKMPVKKAGGGKVSGKVKNPFDIKLTDNRTKKEKKYKESYKSSSPGKMIKKAGGGKLKAVPEGKKGLSKLPTPVRNKMGFMKKGGMLNKKGKK